MVSQSKISSNTVLNLCDRAQVQNDQINSQISEHHIAYFIIIIDFLKALQLHHDVSDSITHIGVGEDIKGMQTCHFYGLTALQSVHTLVVEILALINPETYL